MKKPASTVDHEIDRAWTMFLYASEDYQKAEKALAAAKNVMDSAKSTLETIMTEKGLRARH